MPLLAFPSHAWFEFHNQLTRWQSASRIADGRGKLITLNPTNPRDRAVSWEIDKGEHH